MHGNAWLAGAAAQAGSPSSPVSVPARKAGSLEHVADSGGWTIEEFADLGERPPRLVERDSPGRFLGRHGLAADGDALFLQVPNHRLTTHAHLVAKHSGGLAVLVPVNEGPYLGR